MDKNFYGKVKDIAYNEFLERYNLQFCQEQRNRVMEYIEMVREEPITNLSIEQERQVILGFISEVDLGLFYYSTYSPELMEELRLCLEHNVPICKLMNKTKFANNDISQIKINRGIVNLKRMMKGNTLK